MRAVLQRVIGASVVVDSEEVARIGKGLAILLGVGKGDCEQDALKLAEKTAGLRIFEDELGKMNLSLLDIGGDALVVSQFTLYADCRKGRRPGFDLAALPEKAEELYNTFVNKLREIGVRVETGCFQSKMLYTIENDGPATIFLDSDV